MRSSTEGKLYRGAETELSHELSFGPIDDQAYF